MADKIIKKNVRRKTYVERETMVPGAGNIILNGKDLEKL